VHVCYGMIQRNVRVSRSCHAKRVAAAFSVAEWMLSGDRTG